MTKKRKAPASEAKLRCITRREQGRFGRGWVVRVRSLHADGVYEYFADTVYGSKEAALGAAIQCRNQGLDRLGMRFVEGEQNARRR